MDTRFFEFVSALLNLIGPLNFPSKFLGSHGISPVSRGSIVIGASVIIVAGLNPRLNAAEYMKGLKLDPGCR